MSDRHATGYCYARRRGHVKVPGDRPPRLLLAAIALAALSCQRVAAETAPVPIRLGQSVVTLNGPWKFHTGDDPSWANPSFDDSTWELVDLTPPPGAHDADVGLTGYVPGWGARGHHAYSGYAWYRLRLTLSAPPGAPLALAGPPDVDDAYQVLVNGRLLGSAGRFSGRPSKVPTVFSIQPRIFQLPPSLSDGPKSAVIALRVWMGPWDLADPQAGGIHIAPSVGEAHSIGALYQVQWLQTIRGYVVEVAEAVAFVLLAVMACTVAAFDEYKRPYFWLGAALVLTALYRANQAAFFWGQFETVQDAEMISIVLLIPLCLAAWTLAWLGWLRQRDLNRIPPAVALLTLVYVAAQFLTRSWFRGVIPPGGVKAASLTATATRLLFLLLTLFIIYRALRRPTRDTWFALPAVVLISIGQFAQELSALGFRGIWFPYGTGVSRTQFAYAAFDAVFFGLLLRQFLLFARARPAKTTVETTMLPFVSPPA